MKHLVKISLFALGLAGLVTVAALGLPDVERVDRGPDTLTFDVACDCRTASPAFSAGNRGDAWIVSGKIFPAGTLPTGTATNDPTLPVRGVAPIGDWTCRGQLSFPFPSAVAAAYSATPFAFNTQYFILNDGRALTAEGYPINPEGERLAVTGGIGGFSGAAGEIQEGPIGTNATGCPNFRAKFTFQSGSVRGGSDH
jgi:hypothetical protein